MKRFCKAALSVLIAVFLVVGMVPVSALPVFAATNLTNGFEGMDSDVFSALGFDTSEIPEGYDAETTDNPYGRELIPENQVYEIMAAKSGNSKIYGKDYNSVEPADIYEPSSGSGTGFQMSASAAADFDGDGLAGEVVYVGYSSDIMYESETGTTSAISLRLYDGKTESFSNTRKIGDVSPYYTIPNDAEASMFVAVSAGQTVWDYNWQNLLQVTAGDYDGDNVSEIAVYVAENGKARVDIYKYQKTSQSGENDWMDMANWSRVWSHAMNGDFNYVPNMVSLVSGDFNRDGIDDLALSYGSVILNEQFFAGAIQYMTTGKAYVLWGSRSKMLQTRYELDLNNEELGEQVRISLIKGDLNGDGVEELIATGQLKEDLRQFYTFFSASAGAGNSTRTITTYLYDETLGLVIDKSKAYKPVDGSWVSTEVTGSSEQKWQSANGFDENYYSLPLMRTNSAVFRPEGSDYSYLYLDSCIYQYAKGSIDLLGEMDEKYDGENKLEALDGLTYWGHRIDVTAKESDGSITGASQGFYVEYGAKSADINGKGFDTMVVNFLGANVGSHSTKDNHRNGYAVMSGKSDGTFTAKIVHPPVTVKKGSEDKYYVETQNTTDIRSIDFCFIDCDIDTVIMEYTGQHYLTYSDPKVLAVIAAPPYFKDVDEVSGGDFASDNCSTSWGQTEGTGDGDNVSVDFSIGAWASNSITTGTGQLDLNGGLCYTLEWEKSTTHSYEYTMTFTTAGGEDAVAFYCIPTENYVYNVKTPDGKGGYEENPYVISNTFSPCYQVLTLDYYESIQGNYTNLPQIAGTAITSTPGDPASYPSSSSGYDVISEWNRDAAGVSFGNGSIEQEISFSTETEETYNMGAEFSFEVGGGLSAQVDLGQNGYESKGGLQFSINPAGGWTTTTMDGTTIAGEVANMPEEFREYGYYFSWKLFSYNYKFKDKTSVPVITYIVNDVSAPPVLPEDFQQDYDRTTSEKNVLTWTYDEPCSNFIIYKYEEFPVGTGLRKLATISPGDSSHYRIKYDDDGTPFKEFYFEDDNLTPYTEYQYSIQIERLDKVPPLSTPSDLVTARTRADDGYPTIVITESDDEADGKLLVYPDKNAYLTLDVKGPAGESMANYYTTVLYQWQKQENGAWTDMIGESNKTLTFASAGVGAEGTYRCRVNVITKNDNTSITAYSDSVELTHAKRPSYMENVALTDVAGGGIELYAEVKNGHKNISGSVPSGMVTFTVTSNSTGRVWQYNVVLNAAGIADQVLYDQLPEGLYTVSAVYSGSYIFKASEEKTLYLSQKGSGYEIDAPTSVTYGDGAELSFLEVTKAGGATNSAPLNATAFNFYTAAELSRKAINGSTEYKSGSVTKGTSYKYVDPNGEIWYFTAPKDATPQIKTSEGMVLFGEVSKMEKDPGETGAYKISADTAAGTYAIALTAVKGADSVTTYKLIEVERRQITLRIPDKKESESDSGATSDIKVVETVLVSGSWAACDLEANGDLKSEIASKSVSPKYYNTAGTEFTASTVRQLCGAYTIEGYAAIDNYSVKYISGQLTVLGATHEVKVGARYFENLSVGNVYMISPDMGSSRVLITEDCYVSNQQTGTRMIFNAVPDTGYEVYDWFINGIPQNSTAKTFIYTLLNEDTTVEVQFAITQNTLIFGTAGDEGGGTISCNDGNLSSGSVILANAYFKFTATPEEGYHFKEWRYTEQNNGTVYDDSDEPYELYMPAVSCSLYAVFERDFYTFSFEDAAGNNGLVASYVNQDGETVAIRSGDSIKGDSVITVEPAAGCSFDSEYRYVSSGSQGTAAAGVYTLVLKKDTKVTGRTQRNKFSLTLNFDYLNTSDQPMSAEIIALINGEERTFGYNASEPNVTLTDLDGGSSVTVEATYPGWVDFVGWTSSATCVTAGTTVNKIASTIAAGETVTKGNPYCYTCNNGTSNVTYYFVAPCNGTFSFTGNNVTVYSSAQRYTITELSKNETITLRLTEKPVYNVTLKDLGAKGTYIINQNEKPDGISLTIGGSGNESGFSSATARIHEGDDFILMVRPSQGYTVSYWQITPQTSGTQYQFRASSLKYTIPTVNDDFTFEPIFSATTYNTISWPTISESTNALTLAPESGYLSSVSQGNDFKFKLSGAGEKLVEKVYANGYEFTTAGNDIDGTEYKIESGGVYSIRNIRENQIITVVYKEIGITVNNVDISALNGTGWSYDLKNEKLTLTKNRLPVSGSNKTSSFAPDFRIVAEETATSVVLDNLTLDCGLTAATGDSVIWFKSDETTLSLVGSNTITGRTNNVIKESKTLTIAGNGKLTVNAVGEDSEEALYAKYLTVSGSPTITINSEQGMGIYCSADAEIGIRENTSVNPNIFIKTYYEGLRAGDSIFVYGGSLHVNSQKTAIYFNGLFLIFGGNLEASTDGEKYVAIDAHNTKSYMRAYYPDGYMCRYLEYDEHGKANIETYSRVPNAYSFTNTGFLKDRYDQLDLLNHKYVYLTPLSSSEDTPFTLSVDVNGKTYTHKFAKYGEAGNDGAYYFIPADAENNTAIIKCGIGSPAITTQAQENSHMYPQQGDTIVAILYSGQLYLHSFLVTSEAISAETETIYKHQLVANTEKYAYTLSGSVSPTVGDATRFDILASENTMSSAGITTLLNQGYFQGDKTYTADEYLKSSSISMLTLDSFAGVSVSTGDYPVYLKGNNYLMQGTASAQPLTVDNSDNRMHLVSDGTGTLTITMNFTASEPALKADQIDLCNVGRLSLFAGDGISALAPVSKHKTSVYYYDKKSHYYNSLEVGPRPALKYGHGWLEDAGTATGNSETLTSEQTVFESSDVKSYLSFYATTTDAKVIRPKSVIYDKSAASLENVSIIIQCPAVNSVLHDFYTDVVDETCTIVAIKGSTETIVARDNYTYTYETFADTNQFGKLELNKAWLAGDGASNTGLEAGEYTLRIYFHDDDRNDATVYTLDLPMTITEQASARGDLTADPATTASAPTVLTRGREVSLKTSFTGTTPKVYEWSVDTPAGITLTESGANAKIKIGESAAFGSYKVTVKSYADAAKSQKLGEAYFYISVVPKATNIEIECPGETPSGDKSYTLYHNDINGNAQSWTFTDAVTMEDGSTNSDAVYSLWGANRATTDVDPDSGVLTIHPNETGQDGKLVLTATYRNADGTSLEKSIDIRLSTDAIVGYTDPAAGGSISAEGIKSGGTLVEAGTSITFTASADENYAFDKWFVNGNEAEDGNEYKIDADKGTLTFTAEGMKRYTVTASFVNTSFFVVKFEAGEHGSISAVSSGTAINSGSRVDKNDGAVITAVPDEYCTVAAWYLDGELIPGYTADSYTLATPLTTDVAIKAEFSVPTRIIRVTPSAHGDVSFMNNGKAVEVTSSAGIYEFEASNLDTVTVMAVPDTGYGVAAAGAWTVPAGVQTSDAICTVAPGEGDIDIAVAFEQLESFTLTINTNSFENGYGTVFAGTTEIPMSTSQAITVYKGDTIVLGANPDAGSILYSWVVAGAEYKNNGDSIDVLKIEKDVTVTATFRRLTSKVTFDPKPENGTVTVKYSLTVGNDVLATDEPVTSGDVIPRGSVLNIRMVANDAHAMEVSSMTINGKAVSPVFNKNLLPPDYTYTIDPLVEDTEISVVFTEVTKYDIIVPKGFEEIAQVSSGPAITTPSGIVSISYEDNGFNSDNFAADGKLSIVEGGAADLTFTPESGYMLDPAALLASAQEVLTSAGSTANAALKQTGGTYTISLTGIDMALDLSGIDSPFIKDDPEIEYITLSIAAPVNGKLSAYRNSVEVLDGAIIESGSAITIRAEADAHMLPSSLTANGEELISSTPSAIIIKDITVATDTAIAAAFEASEYKLTITISGTGSGKVSINGSACDAGEYWIPKGSKLTFAGVPDTNSALSSLTVAGSTTDMTLTLSADADVAAEFVDSARTVTVNAPAHGSIKLLDAQGKEIADGTTMLIGAKVYVVTTADAHYAQKTLTIGGQPLTEDYFLVDAVRGNDVYCEFTATEVTVNWTATDGTISAYLMPNGDTITNGQFVDSGSLIKFVTEGKSSNYAQQTFTVTGAEKDDATGWYKADQTAITANATFRYTGDAPSGGGSTGGGSTGGGGTTVIIRQEEKKQPDVKFGVIIEVKNEKLGTVSVSCSGEEIKSGDELPIESELLIKVTPAKAKTKYTVKINGVDFNGDTYAVYANTKIEVEFKDKNKGLPFYVDASGKHVYVGFSDDVDEDGYYTDDEFIFSSALEIDFEEHTTEFTDEIPNWAKPYVAFVADREIFVGNNGKFDPDGSMTREMFITVIGRLYERSYGELNTANAVKFDDCNYKAYYGKYVDWASANGISNGTGNGMFGVGNIITRQEMTTMLYRFIQFMGIDTDIPAADLAYKDADKISKWAVDSVKYCDKMGIIQGKPDGRFAPTDEASRAEAATAITRFIKSMFR